MGWSFAFQCWKRTYAHTLCFAREGESGQNVKRPVAAANKHLEFNKWLGVVICELGQSHTPSCSAHRAAPAVNNETDSLLRN